MRTVIVLTDPYGVVWGAKGERVSVTETELTAFAGQFEEAIDRLEAAQRACPDDGWATSMWPFPRPGPWVAPLAAHHPGRPVR